MASNAAATKLICRRELDALRPVNAYGLEKLYQIPQGELVNVSFKHDRSAKHNALYWGLISIVWENLDHKVFPTPEDFHSSMKIMHGERRPLFLPAGAELVMEDGEVVTVGDSIRAFVPGSTAFGRMSQDRFSAYFDAVCDTIAQYFLPGVKLKELRDQVSQMIGIK